MDDLSRTATRELFEAEDRRAMAALGIPAMPPPLADDRARELMRAAYREAVDSPDRSTQNGAVLVTGDGRAMAAACNHFAAGVDEADPAAHERPLKYAVTRHAEEAIVQFAARCGIPTAGRTLVCCWAACPPCSRDIIGAGIRRVYVHGERMDATPERWRPEVDLGLRMLADAGVELVRVEGPVQAGVTIRFDGQDVEV